MKEKREVILADPVGYREQQINKKVPDDFDELSDEEQQKIIDEKEAGIKRGVVETNGKDSPQVFRAEAQGRRIQIQTPRRS